MNGGRLETAPPKNGIWYYEPKYNGWRVLVHTPSGACFNRHGQPLSIQSEFRPALQILARTENVPEWLDCEGLERRHGIGRGSLIVLDAPSIPGHYFARRLRLEAVFPVHAIDEPLPPNQVAISQHVIAQGGSAGWCVGMGFYETIKRLTFNGRHADPANVFFEGVVTKRACSHYPVQLHSPDCETPDWIKHRFI